MTKRSVVVELMARVGQYVSGMGTAAGATDKLARSQDQAGKAHSQAAQQSQKAAAAVSAAMAKEAQAAKDSATAKGLAYNADGKLVDSSGKVVTAAKAAEAGMDQYSDAVKQAAQATESATAPLKKADSTLQQVAKSAKENREAWDQAGTALTTFGAVTVGVLGATAKAAMDWESAWAGVNKTVDGTSEQMAELEGGLRGLAKTLPLAHGEIAAVAEAAGQLGVARGDILGFTKTMIDLGESTNLTADEAATQIAQISNVMGTMGREGAEGVSRFGATLVELGNNGASTEADILAMSQRIAGAMATVGGSEVEVLALSNALASMGIRAEMGGGVTTRVLLGMYSAIQDGGPKLEAFAKTAGVSAEQFGAAFKASPVTALSMVTQGLGRVKDEGGNVVASLSDMGIKGTEATQVMLALANSGTLLEDGLAQGNQAWKENTALIEEASKRYETTESKVKIAWNGIKDAAIDAGAVILPVIVEVSETVGNLAAVFGDLPAPVQGALTGLAGVAGAGALAAGGLLLLVPRAMETVTAFKTLKTDMPGVSTGLGRVAKAAGLASAAFVGFEIVKNLHNDMQPATASVEEMTQALIGLGDEKDSVNDVFTNIDFGEGDRLQGQIDGVGDALGRLTNQDFWDAGASFGDTVLGIDNGMAKLRDTVEQLDQSIAASATSGNMDLAAQGFKSVADAAADQGVTLEEVAARFPAYMDALRASANAAGVTVTEQELLNWAMGETPAKMLAAEEAARKEAGAVDVAAEAAEAAAAASEELIEALAEIGISAEGTIIDLQKFTDMLFSMGLATMSSRDAAFTWEETLRGMGAAAQAVIDSQTTLGPLLNATGTDFNTMTDSGKAANEMLQGIITEGLNVASTFSGDLSKSTADVSAQLRSTYDAGVQSAMGLGLGEDAAIALTRELMGIPPGVSVETWMSDAAEMRADTTGEAIGEIPESVHVNTSMDMAAFETAGMTKKAADDIPNQETIDSWMSDAAFMEAIRTRAAALGIPEHEAISSYMSSAARNEADATTSQILKIPPGASVSAFMESYARDMAHQTKAAIDAIPRSVYTKITTERAEILTSVDNRAPRSSLPVRGYASGGRLPTTGPGTEVTDGILGVDRGTGAPVSWLDGGEWVVNAKSSDKHHSLLAAINRDDPRLGGLPGLASGGRISGLSARPGEQNWEWQARQLQIIKSMEDTVGHLADWEIHEDGSGWVRTMDDTMIRIADGAWTVTDSAGNAAQAMGRSAEDAHWAGETARAAGGSFQGAGMSANAAAGTFQLAGKVTQQAAQAILAATAAVNSAGQKRAAAKGGGLTAQAGEANAVWRGRQDQFEQSLSKQYGGIRYSDIHEDGSGQIVLDDGRMIELNQGRWQFVSKFKYGAPLHGRTVSKYATGGRLPTSGPGTHRKDGILGVSSLTGEPTSYVDAGEWVINAKASQKYDPLLAAINRDDPRLSSITALAGGGRASREYVPAPAYTTAKSGSGEEHFHYHIDAKPGLAYQYGLDIARQAEQRKRDLQAAYGN